MLVNFNILLSPDFAACRFVTNSSLKIPPHFKHVATLPCEKFGTLYAIARPSVVCNVRAPYSGGSNSGQYFYGVRYLGHPLTSSKNFTEIVPGELLRRGS